MRVALLCSGLGHIHRGHEVFARDLFDLLQHDLDIQLFKGGGENRPRETVLDNLPRNDALLRDVHVAVSPRWAAAVQEQERIRIEGQTFAYSALKPLMAGGYDVVHCLEQEVCEVIHANRHLFARPPKVLFSNGGAIPAADLPPCDFVQEHTDYNLARSARHKAFMIPHGVDMQRFRAGDGAAFRARLGIPRDAFVVISVGTICHWHKRMDHVIREVAALEGAHLLIVGQEAPDSGEIKALGRQMLGERVHFMTLTHDELPQAYAAADVFALGSLFETFGIVYIEAMAMGLPVVSTNHPNQRSIVKEGVFIDMNQTGALTAVLRDTPRETWQALGRKGRDIVARHYDLGVLKAAYLEHYARIAAAPSTLPQFNLRRQVGAHAGNAVRRLRRLLPLAR